MGEIDPKAKPSSRTHKLASGGEEEVYAALGALLGTIEVIAADDLHPIDRVQVERLRSAGRLGRRIHHYLEALLILSVEDLGDRLRCTRMLLRPLVEHALRGAIRSCEAYAVAQQLPAAEAWGDGRVLVDASRVDRVLCALVEALAAQVGEGGTIEVSTELTPEHALLELSGRRGAAAPEPARAASFGEEGSLLGSPLLNRAWERLFALHGGELTVDDQLLAVRIRLPTVGTT